MYDAASSSGAGEDYKDSAMELLCPEGPEKKHGQYVAINGGREMWVRLYTIGQKSNQHIFIMKANTADLNHICKLTEEGWQGADGEPQRLSPVVTHQFQFNSENVEKGFELLKGRRVVGKIVFNMTDEK